MSTLQSSFPVERAEALASTKVVTETNDNVTTSIVDEIKTAESEYTSPVATMSGKSQLIALLLCVFVGGLGIHRFYLGYKTEGIIQLLTLGGCGVWALIDLIRIVTGDLQPKNGRYTETL
ncbi:TM2 domain-containing protein [Capnocytophaga sp. ARDL2]|uniref:TM2 domain-containing protein n=1 Tax=Capnocytophaga sp. ARDL2 TaxID=3238809 RepID=UPI003556C411